MATAVQSLHALLEGAPERWYGRRLFGALHIVLLRSTCRTLRSVVHRLFDGLLPRLRWRHVRRYQSWWLASLMIHADGVRWKRSFCARTCSPLLARVMYDGGLYCSRRLATFLLVTDFGEEILQVDHHECFNRIGPRTITRVALLTDAELRLLCPPYETSRREHS
jgi:hypothetical protein